VGASEDGFIRYYAGVALANRADGLRRNAKALVRRKRIFPFLRVGKMGTFWWMGFGEDSGKTTGCKGRVRRDVRIKYYKKEEKREERRK